jgi:microcystin-dependent protein
MANFLKSLFIKGVEIDPAGASSDQVLKYNGTKFVPGTASTVGSIDDLSDVVITSATTGQALVYNGTNWVNGAGGGSSVTVSDTPPSSPSEGDLWFESDTASTYVYYDSAWVEVGAAATAGDIDSLSDVVITSATTGQVLKYNGTNWVNGTDDAGTTIDSIDDIADVTITDAASGDFLQWNGTAWVNQDDGLVPAGGLEGQIISKVTDTDHDLQWIDNYTGDLRIIAKNDSGVTISKGQVVMAVGAVGDRIQIAKAVADGSVSSKYMLGLASQDILDSEEGYVQMLGEIRNLNTIAYAIGTVLYINPASAGGLTNTEPTAPNLAEAVAIVTRSHASTGILFVRMWSQGESVSELHDVSLTSPDSGDVLTYNGSVWVNTPGMPSGSITQFAGSTAPSGWLSCDGTTVSRTTYAALFAVIGTTYGAGDGSTTFALPNMKGKVPVGIDASQTEFDALGEAGGAKTHTLTEAQMPSHTHIQNAHSHTGTADTAGAHNHGYTSPYNTSGMGPAGSYGFYFYSYSEVTSTAGSHGHNLTIASATPINQNTGGGAAHNNLQPYIVLNYIIKA